MNELTSNVNWLAVIVGTVVAYIIGAFWFSPKVFGAKWLEGVNLKSKETSTMPVAALVVQFIGTFLLAWIVGITAAQNALLTIILIVLAIMTLIVANGLFTQKSSYAMTVEAAFVAVMAIVMIVAQGIF